MQLEYGEMICCVTNGAPYGVHTCVDTAARKLLFPPSSELRRQQLIVYWIDRIDLLCTEYYYMEVVHLL